eukprot:SRR837773.27307.p3 GENE.SRR837773.27307~~SRR837773.27307.p3  ORF type:complete len:118 (-),score=46.66 SRR837773.27307:56-409(-)
MFGLLRLAAAAPRARLPASLTLARVQSIPFMPTDWMFRFFPYFSKDRVRWLLRFNQISFMMGFGYLFFWGHTPYGCDHYEGFYESPLYRYVRGNLEKTGQLEENLRIKHTHFYGNAA